MAGNSGRRGGSRTEVSSAKPISTPSDHPVSDHATPAVGPEMALDKITTGAGNGAAEAEAGSTSAARPAEQPSPGLRIGPPAPGQTATIAGTSDTVLHIVVISGGITHVKAEVAVVGRYQGLPLAGPAKYFDRQLDSWLTRAVDLGMIPGGLGQIFLVPLEKSRAAGKSAVDHLLVVGGGEPGRLTPDDGRFYMSNVTVAVKAMGCNKLSTNLIGRRNEFSIQRALRSFLEGILDGCAHFRAMVAGVTENQERFQQSADAALFIYLVEDEKKRAQEIYDTLLLIKDEPSIPRLDLHVEKGEDVPPEPRAGPNAVDIDPDEPMTLLRISNATPSAVQRGESRTGDRCIFQFSALGEHSAITLREHEVNAYFVRHLPGRLTSAASVREQEDFGIFLMNYLIHDDFRPLIEGDNQLTLVLDEKTAEYPWEMAAYKSHSTTCFFGTDLRLARRFRSLLSPPPGSTPPLNADLRVLIIANPAPGRLSLRGAQMEGLAVVEVLEQARKTWEARDLDYRLKVTVRIGSYLEKDDEKKSELQEWLQQLRQLKDLVESAEACDPLELAMLIVDQPFDVVHYAGHGVFDKDTRQAGWIFDEDCVLSAEEIFRVRRIPRLVFANACFSAVTAPVDLQVSDLATAHAFQRKQLVGLAQAFFARGIPNYIGTGWKVDDLLAQECAREFYTQVLGLRRPPTAPPATLGQSLSDAREVIRQRARNVADRANADVPCKLATWGAYQFYGRANDKLLALPNARSHPQT